MQVGDLVRLISTTAIGVVVKIVPQIQNDLDDLFPYLVYFFDGMPMDFHEEEHLELISEYR